MLALKLSDTRIVYAHIDSDQLQHIRFAFMVARRSD
jgi:hypothetical protein